MQGLFWSNIILTETAWKDNFDWTLFLLAQTGRIILIENNLNWNSLEGLFWLNIIFTGTSWKDYFNWKIDQHSLKGLSKLEIILPTWR